MSRMTLDGRATAVNIPANPPLNRRGSTGGVMTMKRRVAHAAAVLLVSLLAGIAPAWAQVATGTVTGTVKDGQGGIVPGATVS